MDFKAITSGFRRLLVQHGPITQEQRNQLHQVAADYVTHDGHFATLRGPCVHCERPIRYGPLPWTHTTLGDDWLESLRRDFLGRPLSGIRIRIGTKPHESRIVPKTRRIDKGLRWNMVSGYFCGECGAIIESAVEEAERRLKDVRDRDPEVPYVTFGVGELLPAGSS